MKTITRVGVFGLACMLLSVAQTPRPAAGVPVRLILTLGHNYGENTVPFKVTDLTVTRGFSKLSVIGLTPLNGAEDSLELFVVVDNCSSCEVGSKFEELSRFLKSRPRTTDIGVAYIQDGQLKIAQQLTRDHERAVSLLNPPSGSKPSNPFRALAELIRGWPASSSRHAILMISNGIDPIGFDGSPNKAAEDAIEAAQRAGVLIYAIYHPSADYQTEEFSQIYQGQTQLAHVSYETGGESYLLGLGPLPSLAPFVADIARHLASQYLLEFVANPEDGPGGFQDIDVKAKISGFEIMAPARVWVPGRGVNDLKRFFSEDR
jgi:hypothetical protein